MFEVPEEILIYAFRYALGRLSSSPYDVAPLLLKNKDKINLYYRKMIAGDIEWFLNLKEDHPKDLIELWKNVKFEMERTEQCHI